MLFSFDFRVDLIIHCAINSSLKKSFIQATKALIFWKEQQKKASQKSSLSLSDTFEGFLESIEKKY